MKLIKLISTVLLFLALIFISSKGVSSQDCKTKEECEKKIAEYEAKLTEVRNQKSTLSSQINFMNTQIALTTVRIQQTEYAIQKTEEEIVNLGEKIEGLDSSLDQLGKVILRKIIEGYKRREVPYLNIFLDSDKASVLFNRLKYARATQENDRRIAFQIQQAKLNFEVQKDVREKKKIELDELKVNLDQQQTDLANQKAAKQTLLAQTQNDERVYQSLLARARAEFAAIQGIIAGAGTETKLRDVSRGETIASVIPGASCNSSGGHLHFIVQEGGSVNNPFNYLNSVGFENCSGSSCGSGDGDAFNPSGSWDWPLNPTIRMNQGYGETWAVKNTWVGSIYRFHNGIDITGSSLNVLAVADGELYRGSYAVGCALSYAKLVHKGSNIATFYLHTYVQ
jgi:peptidoglycan hydrolase CwlO-like protein